MNEVRALIEAFDIACAAGIRCALATIVSVDGSAYRQPGARMLVREDRASSGTISAGCLEADVVEHAVNVMRHGVAKVVKYDTASTNEDLAWGLGLGCNGIVNVLIEPITADSLYIEVLRRSCGPDADNTPTVVGTIYQHIPLTSRHGPTEIQAGARLAIDQDGNAKNENLTKEAAAALESELRMVYLDGKPAGSHTWDVQGIAHVFVESLVPPVRLVIFGSGQDALPVVELAQSLGWQTEIVDPQARPVSVSRFGIADRVILARPDEVRERVSITHQTVTLVMSHNYIHDLALLKLLVNSPASYIGVMGPRERTERMLRELAVDNLCPEQMGLDRIHSPVGLDIGAAGPAAIALSIVGEICAVLHGRVGGMLRERGASIHGDDSKGHFSRQWEGEPDQGATA